MWTSKLSKNIFSPFFLLLKGPGAPGAYIILFAHLSKFVIKQGKPWNLV